jgi:molybdopterin molybdotransferase
MREFEVVGTQAAGRPAISVSRSGQCVEVMTGAMLPEGTDSVVPLERVVRDGDFARIVAPEVNQRQFVHSRGSDRRVGALMLAGGTHIGPPEVAVLASAGRDSFDITALPEVAVISTGDELVDVDEPIAPFQIRSSNDRALEACLTTHRLARVTRTRLKDDTAELTESIAELHTRSDVLILSGGVSKGQFDFVPQVLERLGARVLFHRVRQRPGQPMWFGVSARGKPIFALPGNPVSTLVCATRYVLPALRAAAGLRQEPIERVTLSSPYEPSPELTHFVPVTLAWSPAGTALADVRRTNTSGDFVTLAGTSGFVELPAAKQAYAAGSVARLFRW